MHMMFEFAQSDHIRASRLVDRERPATRVGSGVDALNAGDVVETGVGGDDARDAVG